MRLIIFAAVRTPCQDCAPPVSVSPRRRAAIWNHVNTGTMRRKNTQLSQIIGRAVSLSPTRFVHFTDVKHATEQFDPYPDSYSTTLLYGSLAYLLNYDRFIVPSPSVWTNGEYKNTQMFPSCDFPALFDLDYTQFLYPFKPNVANSRECMKAVRAKLHIIWLTSYNAFICRLSWLKCCCKDQ